MAGVDSGLHWQGYFEELDPGQSKVDWQALEVVVSLIQPICQRWRTAQRRWVSLIGCLLPTVGILVSFLSTLTLRAVRSATIFVSCLTCSLRSSITSAGTESVCTPISDVSLGWEVSCLSHWMAPSFVDFPGFSLLRRCCFWRSSLSVCSARNTFSCSTYKQVRLT